MRELDGGGGGAAAAEEEEEENVKITEEEERGGKLRCSDGVYVRDNRRKRAGRRRFSQVRGQLLVTDTVLQKYTGGRRCAYDSSLPSSCCPNDSDAS